jgi:hypothetical protein
VNKITLPLQTSIIDPIDSAADQLDSDDDDVLFQASQQFEAEDFNKRQQVESHNVTSYGGFMHNAPSTSSTQQTQLRPPPDPKTGFTELIHNQLFVDNTKDKYQDYEASQNSSQKENISSPQSTHMRQQNQIKELQAKIAQMTVKVAEQAEKLLIKDGEAKNLRLSKKTVEESLTKMRMEKLQVLNKSQIDHEKEEMRRQISRLKAQNDLFKLTNFPQLNNSMIEPTLIPPPKIRSRTRYFTNFPLHSPVLPAMSPAMFDVDLIIPVPLERMEIVRERQSRYDVVQVQLKLAQTHARIIAGGLFSDAIVDDTFRDASFMIFRIIDYIKYLEDVEESLYDWRDHSATSIAGVISMPDLRSKLTRIKKTRETIVENSGKISIFQADKLFPEELCAKPRRMIAFYASLAKHSRKFAEKLLFENITDDEENPQTFVKMLTESMQKFVVESNEVYDYSGFAMAVASLLSSLSVHYASFSNSCVIDSDMFNLLRAVLQCRCDNPILMVHVAQFIADISMQPNLMSRICVNFETSKVVEVSKYYRYHEFPSQACLFQLFISYLLTSFVKKLNSYELQLAMETLMNLNRITSNVQELRLGVVKFLKRSPIESMGKYCECLQQLTNATLSLNHLVLAHRNARFVQTYPVRKCSKSSIPLLISDMKFHKCKFLGG